MDKSREIVLNIFAILIVLLFLHGMVTFTMDIIDNGFKFYHSTLLVILLAAFYQVIDKKSEDEGDG